MKKLLTEWRKFLKEDEGAYYHITRSENVPSIMRSGLTPVKPMDMEGEAKGVYLFRSIDEAEDALMGWLGERFSEDDPLTLLRVDSAGVGELDTDSAAGFEAVSRTAIAPEFILPEKEYPAVEQENK